MADVLKTDYAEGLVLPMEDESKIRQDWLETFSYEGPRQRVCYELTGIVWVEYIPNTKLIELKSLKYYFISYRNVGIFQEAVTAKIFEDLWDLLDPEWLQIRTTYATRGGIDTTCTVDSKDQDSV